MIPNRSKPVISTRFRPAAEALEGRSLMAIGQISLFIPSAAVGLPPSQTVRGSLPDGSIDVQQFNVATSNPTTIGSATGGAGTGKVQFLPLEIIVAPGPQSAALFQVEAVGAHFNTATLTVRDTAARVIETLSFKLVFVSSDAISGSSGAAPIEDLKFAYGAYQITTFNPTTQAPQVQTSFNLVTNTPTFDAPGVTAQSLPKATATHVSVAKAHPVHAEAVSTAVPTTIKLTVAKPHHGRTLLTAKVASKNGPPTGNVTFYSGKTELGQVAVGPDGRATLSASTALIGKSKPYAIYSGGPGSAFQPATTVTGEATIQKSFQKWLARPMTQDEWVLTSMWLQQGFTPAKMANIYKSLATRSS
jgi:type VI secretion system secreted protein Hcp